MSIESPVIETNGLKRRYGKIEAVNGLDLTVRAGRCYGFFGRNGAGKTTTIKCLLNLLRPQSGSVRVFGLDPRKNEVEVKSRLAYVPDAVAFYPWMTVREVLNYFASFRRHWNPRTERELLQRFGLDPGKQTASLSKGQKTQLALVAAICPEPELLILDEPTNGLDAHGRKRMLEIIREIRDSQDTQIILCSHLLRDVEECCDEVMILKEGKLVTHCNLEAERRTNRKFIQMEAHGETGTFLTRVEQLGCELAVNGSRKLKMILPEAVEVKDLYRIASETGVQIRRLDFKRDSLQDIFLKAMETPNGRS